MKILHIIYALGPGGAERFVLDICNELSAKGHKLYLCAMRDNPSENQNSFISDITSGIRYIPLGIPSGFRFSNIYRLYKLIRKIKPDIVHGHLNLINYIFPITFLFPKVRFFHTIHNDAPREVKSHLEYFIRKYFYKHGWVKPITISGETTRSFVDYYGIKQYAEIYNGRSKPTATDEFWNVKHFVEMLREGNKMVFLHVARFASQKNQELLIRTFNRLLNENYPVVLLIVGLDFDLPEGKELKRKARKGIWFLGEKHNVADYYLNADAFCLTSRYEGMPITLIESLACGCIPICTPVGGIISTIRNGVNGFVSPSLSEEDYYKTVLEFMNSRCKIHKKDLINFFEKNLSIELCAQKHISEYQKN